MLEKQEGRSMTSAGEFEIEFKIKRYYCCASAHTQ